MIPILHDTTELTRQRKRPEAVGFTTTISSGKDRDPPLGNTVIWQGLSRLNDIALRATLQVNNVGK